MNSEADCNCMEGRMTGNADKGAYEASVELNAGHRKVWAEPKLTHVRLSDVTQVQKAVTRTDNGGQTPSHKS